MLKRLLILIPGFYFLALFQPVFLPLNIILILVILLNLFEKTENPAGVFSALSAGFFWDIYSSRPFGLYILILLAISIFIKAIVKKYVQI